MKGNLYKYSFFPPSFLSQTTNKPTNTAMLLKFLCVFIFALFIQSTFAQATEITKADAIDVSIPHVQNVNNDYPGSGYELPTSEWSTIGATNTLWYRVAASSLPRTIRASTCTTHVDTVVGIYYYVSGSPVGALNDDRVDPVMECDQLSSFVELVIPADSEFYVIVASFYPNVGDIDLSIVQYVSDSDLLTTTANTIISSLSTEIADSETALQTTLAQLSTDISTSTTQLSGEIDTLGQSVNTQFTLLGADLVQLNTDLSTAIDSSETAISAQISTLSGNLASVPSGVTTIQTTTATTSSNVQSLLTNVAAVQSSANDITADVADVATSIATLSTDLSTAATGINGNIATLSTATSSRFNDVDTATAAVKADTSDLITRVNNVNAVSQGTFDLLEASSFEGYLLLTGTAVAQIPWKYRTPASYMGQMEDLLNFVDAVYNEKLTACDGLNTEACVWFRANTQTSYSTLVASYNTQVTAKRFKKAFDVIQSFYLRLYPTSLFI